MNEQNETRTQATSTRHAVSVLVGVILLACSALTVLINLADKYKHFNDSAVDALRQYSPSSIEKIYDEGSKLCWVGYTAQGFYSDSGCDSLARASFVQRMKNNELSAKEAIFAATIGKLKVREVCTALKPQADCRDYEPNGFLGRTIKFFRVALYTIHKLFGDGFVFFAVWIIGSAAILYVFGEKAIVAAFLGGLFFGSLLVFALISSLLLLMSVLGQFFGLLAWIGSSGFGAVFVLLGGVKKAIKELQDLRKQGQQLLENSSTNSSKKNTT